jgi:hypothetical protein
MDASAYVGEVIAGCVYLFVGVRLFLLSLKTSHTPEKLIAASFLLWVIAYAIWDIPYAFVESEELVPAVCSYGSLIAISLGNITFTFFIRAGFRPEERWAIGLVAAITVSLVLGVGGAAWIGDWEGINPFANPWYWLDFLGNTAPSIWMMAEGLIQYFKARKRLKLGFCSPMACNHFLLWGIAGSFWLILEVVVTASDLVYALTGQWSESLGMATALFEIFPITVVWFVFFPPSAYRRWVEGAASA